MRRIALLVDEEQYSLPLEWAYDVLTRFEQHYARGKKAHWHVPLDVGLPAYFIERTYEEEQGRPLTLYEERRFHRDSDYWYNLRDKNDNRIYSAREASYVAALPYGAKLDPKASERVWRRAAEKADALVLVSNCDSKLKLFMGLHKPVYRVSSYSIDWLDPLEEKR